MQLNSGGYHVVASEAYPDPATGKSRELDLYAISTRRIGSTDGRVWPVLLVECVNNPQPFVLLTKRTKLDFMYCEEAKIAGLPAKLLTGNRKLRWAALPDALEFSNFHHYCTERIATQFCSFTRKKENAAWLAQHETAHFDSIGKHYATRLTIFRMSFSDPGISNREERT